MASTIHERSFCHPLSRADDFWLTRNLGFPSPQALCRRLLRRLTLNATTIGYTLRKRGRELKADRRWQLGQLSRRAEPAGLLIKPEDNDVIGFLVRHQQKRSRWIDGKVARRHAPRGFVADRGESAVAWVNRENSNAVVTPVRTIEKSAIGRNVDVCTCVRTREILRQSSYGLQFFQTSVRSIAREGSYRRVQFVKDENILATRIKSQMARPRAWLDLHPGWFTRQQLSVSCVEAENHNLICSQIA